ncbi:unnamed protein product, partial [Iphiclides podalirius]
MFCLLMHDFAGDRFGESLAEQSIFLCWECAALLRRFDKFKRQVHTAQGYFCALSLSCEQDPSEEPMCPSQSQPLSTLGLTVNQGYDKIYFDCTSKANSEGSTRYIVISTSENIKDEYNIAQIVKENIDLKLDGNPASGTVLESPSAVVSPHIVINSNPLGAEDTLKEGDDFVVPGVTVREGKVEKNSGRGSGRGRVGADTTEEYNTLSETRAERQARQSKVAVFSHSVKQELPLKKRAVETNGLLHPDAPPRKRCTRKPSPEREPCCYMPGADPSSVAESGSFAIKKEVEQTSGAHDPSFEGTIDENESENGLCADETYETDETDFDPPHTTQDEPASMADYTAFEGDILESEDAINDSALRSIAPENAFDFPWRKEESAFQGRRETFTGTPGPTFDVTDSILDVFYKMFDVEFVDMLCAETNSHASQRMELLRSQGKLTPNILLHRWVPTDRDEMITFLATLILQGLYHIPEQERYFKHNGFGTMPYFRAIMSYKRFLLLKTTLHFAASEAADTASELWKVKPVVDYFNGKFSGLYYPSREVVVDESLLKWQGRLGPSRRISSGPSTAPRVGMRACELCECSTGYVWRFSVYAGKKERTGETTEYPIDYNEGSDIATPSTKLVIDNGDVRPIDAPALVVYKLVEPLLYRGHTLITDNRYNSPLLARCLKRQKTDVYGTLRLNREFVPDSLKSLTETDLKQGETVASYCSDLSVMVWRDANLVGMISTYHPPRAGAAPKHRPNCKPNIVLEYNKAMGGLERKDQFLSAHPVERGENVACYKKLFRRLYNAAIFNSYIIYTAKNPNISHRRFRTSLAEDLLKAHRKIDLASITMPSLTKRKSGNRCIVEEDHFPIRTGSKKTRCWLCYQLKIQSRTIWKCRQCQVNLCIEGCFRSYHKA